MVFTEQNEENQYFIVTQVQNSERNNLFEFENKLTCFLSISEIFTYIAIETRRQKWLTEIRM